MEIANRSTSYRTTSHHPRMCSNCNVVLSTFERIRVSRPSHLADQNASRSHAQTLRRQISIATKRVSQSRGAFNRLSALIRSSIGSQCRHKWPTLQIQGMPGALYGRVLCIPDVFRNSFLRYSLHLITLIATFVPILLDLDIGTPKYGTINMPLAMLSELVLHICVA